jgi:Fe2+ transport system protein FeoA
VGNICLTLADAACHQRLRVVGFQGNKEFQQILMERGIRKGVEIYKCCKGYDIIFKVGTMRVALREDASKNILVEVID